MHGDVVRSVRKSRCSLFIAIFGAFSGYGGVANGDAYDAPANYYSSATGTGAVLKLQLYNITITGFTYHSYGDARYTENLLWADPSNSNNTITVYQGKSVTGAWDGGVSWNREHQIPEHVLSVGADNAEKDYGTDEFNLAPSVPSDNSSRGDDGYGFTGSTSTPSRGAYGTVNGTGDTFWYPGANFSGDVARTAFYMATRYGFNQGLTTGLDKNNAYNLTLANGPSTYNTSGAGVTKGQMGDLNSLLHFAYEDPVDTFERRKNQLVYTGLTSANVSNGAIGAASQGNRNPYIDHPEYIWAVFGTKANTSQLSIGTPSADGSSGTAISMGKVIVGSSFSTTPSVTLSKAGDTPTTFNVTTSGKATSSLAGTGQTFTYNASSKSMIVGLSAPITAGAVSGNVVVDNTDLTSAGIGNGSADGDDTVTLSGTAVDHSNASFSLSSDVNNLNLSFGTFAQNSGVHTLPFSVTDLLSASGYTADLDLDGINGVGNTSALSTNLSTFSEVAGNSSSFMAILNSSIIGIYSAQYTLAVSDENIPGATAGTSLILNLTGSVIAVPEPSALIVISVTTMSLLGRRRRCSAAA